MSLNIDQETVSSLLLESFSTTDQERIDYITNFFREFYTDPNSIFILLDIIRKNSKDSTVHAASISLHKSLKKLWSKLFCGNENGETLKKTLLETLLNEKRKFIRNRLIYAMNVIFETDGDSWSDLYDFLHNLGESLDVFYVDIAIFISQFLINKISTETFSREFDFFKTIAYRGFLTNDTDISINSCGLVSVLVRLVPVENIETLKELYTHMIDLFEQNINNKSTLSQVLARLEFSLESSDLPIDPKDLIVRIIQILNNNYSDSDILQLLFLTLSDIIVNFGDQLSDDNNFISELLHVCFDKAVQTFTNESYDDQLDMNTICLLIENISEHVFMKDFFDLVIKILDFDKYFDVSLIILSGIIDNKSESVMKNLNMILDKVFYGLESQYIATQEAAFICMELIGSYLQEDQSFIANKMIRKLIERLSNVNSNFVILFSRGLESLSKILFTSDIDSDLIQPTIQLVFSYVNNRFLESRAVEVLSNLILSADKEILIFLDQNIINYIIDKASIQENVDPLLKQNAIECVGNLLRFAYDQLLDVLPHVLALLFTCFESEDLQIKSAVIFAFQNMVISKRSELLEYKKQIFQVVQIPFTLFLNNMNTNNSDDSDFDEYVDNKVLKQGEDEIRFIHDGLLLVKNIFKYFPDLLAANITYIIEHIYHIVSSNSDDLQGTSIFTLAYIIMYMYKIDSSTDLTSFIIKCKDIIDDSSSGPLSISYVYRGFSKIIQHNISIPGDMLQYTLDKGIYFLNQIKNAIEEEDTYRNRDSNILRYFASVSSITSNYKDNGFISFVEYFVRLTKYIIKNTRSNFLKSQYIGVLRQILIFGSDSLGDILLNVIRKIIIESVDICDFNVIPEPILGIKWIIANKPALLDRYQEQILESITNLIEMSEFCEYSIHYYTTITDIRSLLCTILMINTIDFDYDAFLEFIIIGIPVKGDVIEARNIYSTIIYIVNNLNHLITDNLKTTLISGFIKTLALPDAILNSYNLEKDLHNFILTYVKNHLDVVDFNTILEDNNLKETFIRRLN